MVMRRQIGHPWVGSSVLALDLPPGIRSEAALRRYLTQMLAKNKSADTHLIGAE